MSFSTNLSNVPTKCKQEFQFTFTSFQRDGFEEFLQSLLNSPLHKFLQHTARDSFKFFKHFDFFAPIFDPISFLNRDFNINFWNNRKIVQRQKVAAKAIFLKDSEPFKTSNFHFNLDEFSHSFPHWKEALWNYWHEDDIFRKMTEFKNSMIIERAAHIKLFKNTCSSPAPYTNKWSRPPGINHLLINPGVRTFYNFIDGSNIFPLNFAGQASLDFFSKTLIPDGAILNPPFSGGLLDKILAKIIKFTDEHRTINPVIVPFWESAIWFKLLQNLNYPIFKLGKIAFRRGNQQTYQKLANFETCLILIGAFSSQSSFIISTDDLGYPLDFQYIKFFSQIKLPVNLSNNLSPDPSCFSSRKVFILQSLLLWAEKWDTSMENTEISNQFDLTNELTNNFALQFVNHSFRNPLSHSHTFRIDKKLRYFLNLETFAFKSRTLFTKQNFNAWLDSFNKPPADNFKNVRCLICKKMGHTATSCMFAIPTKAQLGLVHMSEIILYDFIKLYHASFTPIKNFSWHSAYSASEWLIKARRAEIIFWQKFKTYACKRGWKNFNSILPNSTFSKSRNSIGFNLVTGAPLYELITDAFGALIHLVDPPPPCIFVPSLSDPHTFFPIPDNIMKEDEKELTRGTQIILPQKHIKYILPRFVVKNSDTTERVINDCRMLGPFTPIIHYRLPRPIDLQKFHQDDIVLSVDGKSAYKQRKLAPSCQNLIGFQTKVDGKPCYVAMTTPPFGLHNAGYIYQNILENKIRRIAGSLPFIEYVDDVLIKVGTIHEDHEIVLNRIKFFITLLTATGEIINNKIEIFRSKLTMMGTNFYLNTRRFTPKLNSAYKLGSKIIKIFTKAHISLLEIQQLAGSINWLLQGTKPPALLDLNFTISRLLKGLNMQNRRDRRIAAQRSIPLTKQFLTIIFNLITEIFFPFSKINTLKNADFQNTLCIIVDSNPLLGAGFIFWNRNFSAFHKLDSLDCVQQKISQTHSVPPCYIKKYNLEKIITSYSSELLGLFRYISKIESFLVHNSHKFSHIKIFIDNLGLISTLNTLSPKKAFTSILHQKVYNFFEKFNKPFEFVWLRRSSSFITKADSLGRFISERFHPTLGLRKKLKRFYSTTLYVPQIFQDINKLSTFLPDILLSVYPNKTPLLMLHPRTNFHQIEFILTMLANTPKKVLIGFPLRRFDLLQRFCDKDSIFRVPKISSTFFQGEIFNKKFATNMPYIYSFVKPAPYFPKF